MVALGRPRWKAWLGLVLPLCGCGDGGDDSPPPGGVDAGIGVPEECASWQVWEDYQCRCSDEACQMSKGSRFECIAGNCREVPACGRIVECEEPEMICDRTSRSCFAESGACDDDGDCPYMFDGSRKLGLHCRDSFCRFDPAGALNVAPKGVDALAVRGIDSSGISVATAEEIEVRLPIRDGVYALIIADEHPETLEDLEQHQVLALYVSARTTTLSVADALAGNVDARVTNGLRDGTLLYLVALHYTGGRLLAMSPVYPLIIGSGWTALGAECAEPGAIPGECYDPDQVQACSPRRECERLCGSHRDCPSGTTEGVCGEPNAIGHRYCER